IEGDFSGVEQALADLKNFSKEQLAQQAQKNESFNVGKSEIYQSVKNGVNGTLVGNGLSGIEATALAKNFSDIKKELNEKFKNFNNNNNGLKNSGEPIYAQVAKKVTKKIDQLNQAASGFGGVGQAGFPLKRHDKVDDLSKVGRSVSPEPIYATIDDLGGPFPLKKHAKVEDLSKVGLSRNQELTQKIDNLSQAVSEAKAGFFGNLEQTIDKLKDSTKNNPVNLWAEGAKKVPASLSAKLDNYATNSHTRINSNIQNGAINEKATGMLTQKNPEWLKLVNDKIVAHNVGSVPLSEYDKIGFNQKNMKDYSDSFKFSTKLNNAVKDVKSGFTQFLANAFSTGYYSLARENAEHGIKNANTKGGFQKS
ncbi:type IV secretion system oncogenic effector CagA, partial [Helicobacter pylori]